MRLLRRIVAWLPLRGWVQFVSTLFANSYFLSGFKGFCYPVLNCWSCPTASFACPIGALQNSAASARLSLRAGALLASVIPFYVLGTLVLFSALFGRLMCGWLCPFGWFQELVGRRGKRLRIPRWTTYLRYVSLVVPVLVIPYYTGEAWFSKLCPMGALEGSIPQPLLQPDLRSQLGMMWYLKLAILAVTIAAAYVWRRPFCGAVCPLGAFFSLFVRYSAWQTRFDDRRCVDCQLCVRNCPQGIDPRRDVNSHACISCLECTKCPYDAIKSQPIWRDLLAKEAGTARRSGITCHEATEVCVGKPDCHTQDDSK